MAQPSSPDHAEAVAATRRKEDEDDRRFAYRCMVQAHKMLKPTNPKRGMDNRH